MTPSPELLEPCFLIFKKNGDVTKKWIKLPNLAGILKKNSNYGRGRGSRVDFVFYGFLPEVWNTFLYFFGVCGKVVREVFVSDLLTKSVLE